MKSIVTDRSGIEAGVLVKSAYIVISIHDTYSPPARVKKQSGLRGLLQLAFDDAEPTTSAELAGTFTLMTAEQAEKIWKFVHEQKDQVGAVVVHCEAGRANRRRVNVTVNPRRQLSGRREVPRCFIGARLRSNGLRSSIIAPRCC